MNDSKYKTNSRHRDPENRIRFHPDSEAAEEILKDINRIRTDAGLPPLKITVRSCLKCEKSFKTLGNTNRLCVNCRPE